MLSLGCGNVDDKVEDVLSEVIASYTIESVVMKEACFEPGSDDEVMNTLAWEEIYADEEEELLQAEVIDEMQQVEAELQAEVIEENLQG